MPPSSGAIASASIVWRYATGGRVEPFECVPSREERRREQQRTPNADAALRRRHRDSRSPSTFPTTRSPTTPTGRGVKDAPSRHDSHADVGHDLSKRRRTERREPRRRRCRGRTEFHDATDTRPTSRPRRRNARRGSRDAMGRDPTWRSRTNALGAHDRDQVLVHPERRPQHHEHRVREREGTAVFESQHQQLAEDDARREQTDGSGVVGLVKHAITAAITPSHNAMRRALAESWRSGLGGQPVAEAGRTDARRRGRSSNSAASS